ncbi:MAG: polymer-forming cytoskeletal protein [Phycisphaerales bacterium]|nr:polymer-forming cytoskeletal protein [Phycisphaerales bacterium]
MTMDQSKNRTVIGADCHVRGELWLENDLLMMGEVEGTLQVMGTLELPASAKVQGQVMCTSLRLAGHVEAEVLAEGEVELLPGAFLAGKLYTPKLMVHDGATLEADVCVGPMLWSVPGSCRS